MATRKELITAVGQRYRESSKGDRTKILDEFTELTEYHRKHARLVSWAEWALAEADEMAPLQASATQP
jgi:hypothetical protein